jgi:hypothetical protein
MKYITEDLNKVIIDKCNYTKANLNCIKKGIYLHVFQPSEDIYENRKNKKHKIESNTVVLKPGKFTGGLFGRCTNYYKSWKYESTHEFCMLNEVKSYLVVDLSKFNNDYVARVEAGLTSIIEQVIGKTKRQENGSKSEYRELLNKEVQLTDEMLKKLTDIIHCQIKNDMALEINKALYIVNYDN